MKVINRCNNNSVSVKVIRVIESDFSVINKTNFHFDWRKEQFNKIYKLILIGSNEILGLMSIKEITKDQRVEIMLLDSSILNSGKNKIYEGIAGNLIAFACRESIRLFAEHVCVSLLPKTELKKHYTQKYGMLDGGKHVYLDGISLFNLIKEYEI